MVERCGHCGREGTLKRVDSVVLNSEDVEISPAPGEFMDVADQDVVVIAKCEVCGEPTMSRYKWLDTPWAGSEDDVRGYRRIYPLPRDISQLPKRVADRYIGMLEVAYIPDAFAVRAGKVLEAVCWDQELRVTREADLATRLDQLASKAHGKIPVGLRDQAHLVRKYRNVGGHDNDFDVEVDDIPIVREFVESLLDYLYIGPAKLERGLGKLRSRQDRPS